MTLRAALVAAALSLTAAPAAAACREDVAEFRWDGGKARFTVEIADDTSERATGLMFREKMPAGSGMLFVYPGTQPVSFWMKNTLIPLDMAFIDETGRVAGVHANAVPGDLTAIPGPGPVRMVLEINGGLAARIGIAEGAELRHPAVDQAQAVWPCDAP